MRKITITVDDVTVALRKESVDRNVLASLFCVGFSSSLSARRAWIEMFSVREVFANFEGSLSARRAWIEISVSVCSAGSGRCRSPQGERG